MSRFRWNLVFLSVVLLSGCGPVKHKFPRFKTFPLTGVVNIDGTSAEGVIVTCTPVGETSEIKFPVTAGTDKEGKFSIGTYEVGDGVPKGDYVLTFVWPEPVMTAFPKDQLKGAYTDPKKSQHNVTVVEGQPNDLGVIELKSK